MSQPNQITLSVDAANDGNPANQVFDREQPFSDRTVYHGPNHSFVARNTMTLYRTYPKRSGLFLGAAKSAVKFTEDITVDDAEGNDTVQPLILELSFSVPVGATAAQTTGIRQRALSFLDNDTYAAPLVDDLTV